jgi:hypothetical protein
MEETLKRPSEDVFAIFKKPAKRTTQTHLKPPPINFKYFYAIPTNAYMRFCNAFAVFYIEKNKPWKGSKAVVSTAANEMWNEKYKPLWRSKRYV